MGGLFVFVSGTCARCERMPLNSTALLRRPASAGYCGPFGVRRGAVVWPVIQQLGSCACPSLPARWGTGKSVQSLCGMGSVSTRDGCCRGDGHFSLSGRPLLLLGHAVLMSCAATLVTAGRALGAASSVVERFLALSERFGKSGFLSGGDAVSLSRHVHFGGDGKPKSLVSRPTLMSR